MQISHPTIDSEEVLALLRRAETLTSAHQLADAEAICRRVVSESPGVVPAYSELGRCLAEQGRRLEAIAAYRSALALDPDFAYVHCNLGLALLGCGRCREAVSSLTQAVSLCPDAWVFRSHLGRALLDCHDFEAAVGEYRKCLEQCAGDPEVGYELGLALIGVGRIAEALAEFQRCVQASPDDFKVHDRIGACLIALKRPWDAVPPLRRATALNPAHADSWMGLSCAFGLAGQRENALAALVQAVSLEPASFSKCWGTFLALTDRFFRIGRARDLAGAGLVLAMALGIGRFRCLANLLLRPLRALAPDAPFEADAAGPTCDTVDNGGLPESAKRGDSAGTSALD